MHTQRSVVLDAVRAGVRGFVSKSADARELVAGVRAVVSGGCFFDARAAGGVLAMLRGENLNELGLSGREDQILSLVCHGYSNQQIAEKMCLSVSSIKNHLRGLFERFGVSDRTSLVTAYEARNRLKPEDLESRLPRT